MAGRYSSDIRAAVGDFFRVEFVEGGAAFAADGVGFV